MIKMPYPPIVIRKIEEIVKEAEHLWGRDMKEKDYYCRDLCGLGYRYLKCVLDGVYKDPSTRVLVNLGFEILLRDKDTGEVEVAKIGLCDWNPRNPQMRVSSTSESDL